MLSKEGDMLLDFVLNTQSTAIFIMIVEPKCLYSANAHIFTASIQTRAVFTLSPPPARPWP